MHPQKIKGPDAAIRSLGVCLGEVLVIIEAVIDEVQAYPTP